MSLHLNLHYLKWFGLHPLVRLHINNISTIKNPLIFHTSASLLWEILACVSIVVSCSIHQRKNLKRFSPFNFWWQITIISVNLFQILPITVFAKINFTHYEEHTRKKAKMSNPNSTTASTTCPVPRCSLNASNAKVPRLLLSLRYMNNHWHLSKLTGKNIEVSRC